MKKLDSLRVFAITVLTIGALTVLWVLIDAPTGEEFVIRGTVQQAVFITTRYSGGYTRIVVQVEGGRLLTFKRYGQSHLKPGMSARIVKRSRRISGLSSYDLLY